ncbi:MAG: glycosyl transferase [Gammaproteobacteria bacterium]|nr:glycosyl transferase [Gammaproteobacteria bacterium]
MSDTAPFICSIVAKNYIAFARTLARSFLEQHPDGRCFVLIVDDTAGFVEPDQEPFELVTLDRLDIPRVQNLALGYDITEFSTSVKPYFLEYLFREYNPETLLYLDPDILVTDSLSPLVAELDGADIILTPHLDTDYPDDGLMPDDSHIMRSGIFNLGFIGLRRCANVDDFLKWWQTKLYDRCLVDPWKGYMVDQKFIDYAYVLFRKIRLVRDPGYNVAYWNIHSRTIDRADDRWLCNGQPLRFFHFSNYKPEQPDRISGHQTRFTFAQRPDLERIFRHYHQLLMQNGYAEAVGWPYSWGQYKDGSRVSLNGRVYFRTHPELHELDDPFDYSAYSMGTRLRIHLLRAKGFTWRVAKSMFSRP